MQIRPVYEGMNFFTQNLQNVRRKIVLKPCKYKKNGIWFSVWYMRDGTFLLHFSPKIAEYLKKNQPKTL